MTSPHTLPVAEIPDDDATLDAILRQGLAAGQWPFATLPGCLPRSTLKRLADRFAVIEAADTAITAAVVRNQARFRAEMLPLLDSLCAAPTSA